MPKHSEAAQESTQASAGRYELAYRPVLPGKPWRGTGTDSVVLVGTQYSTQVPLGLAGGMQQLSALFSTAAKQFEAGARSSAH